jgi:hypothetical protein
MDPGSHVGFQISTKNTNLVEDHPVNISGKFDADILKRTYLCQVSDTGSPEPLVFFFSLLKNFL